ncbi:MAG: hypothetical protein SOR61_07665 [Evtepia sp.]|uniref:hypothetical protein n=1 Tax=Evtepia sp. TaxID=2773933 RepID=UPI002A752016|nr:hypothetical protein [Evtepia sp.]MDY3015041.1 hypothetical protein [Evtepia sp.]
MEEITSIRFWVQYSRGRRKRKGILQKKEKFRKIMELLQFCLEKHWTIGPAAFIIYNVLVSLQADSKIWGKREFGKEKQR